MTKEVKSGGSKELVKAVSVFSEMSSDVEALADIIAAALTAIHNAAALTKVHISSSSFAPWWRRVCSNSASR
jgi:hypothetical protein